MEKDEIKVDVKVYAGCPGKIDAARSSQPGESACEIELALKLKTVFGGKGQISVLDEALRDEVIDAISASAKLTKADAGRALDAALESSIKLRTFKVMEPEI